MKNEFYFKYFIITFLITLSGLALAQESDDGKIKLMIPQKKVTFLYKCKDGQLSIESAPHASDKDLWKAKIKRGKVTIDATFYPWQSVTGVTQSTAFDRTKVNIKSVTGNLPALAEFTKGARFSGEVTEDVSVNGKEAVYHKNIVVEVTNEIFHTFKNKSYKTYAIRSTIKGSGGAADQIFRYDYSPELGASLFFEASRLNSPTESCRLENIK